MPADLDLDAYFTRIGHDGPRAPTLETLRALHARHADAITFENLNPLLGWPVRLDLPALVEKIVAGGRGGYCFEQNALFRDVLEALGYRVTGLAARVLWGQPEDAITSRSHMLLRLDLDGDPWIADVGFGGQTLTGPLRLVPDIEQATPHEPFRLVQHDHEYRLQALIEAQWRTLYGFDLQPQYPLDYEAPNHYVATHPSSKFTTTLRVARSAPGRRYALLNNQLAVHHLHGATQRRELHSVGELRRTLEEDFRLRLPDTPALDEMLKRFV
jgi:N-hydroxyarylamine O-acetyltransferase